MVRHISNKWLLVVKLKGFLSFASAEPLVKNLSRTLGLQRKASAGKSKGQASAGKSKGLKSTFDNMRSSPSKGGLKRNESKTSKDEGDSNRLRFGDKSRDLLKQS